MINYHVTLASYNTGRRAPRRRGWTSYCDICATDSLMAQIYIVVEDCRRYGVHAWISIFTNLTFMLHVFDVKATQV